MLVTELWAPWPLANICARFCWYRSSDIWLFRESETPVGAGDDVVNHLTIMKYCSTEHCRNIRGRDATVINKDWMQAGQRLIEERLFFKIHFSSDIYFACISRKAPLIIDLYTVVWRVLQGEECTATTRHNERCCSKVLSVNEFTDFHFGNTNV